MQVKAKECTWQHGDAEFRLKTEEREGYYAVYLSIDRDVSVMETNPISIFIRLEALTALDEKFYVMSVGDITVRNIPEEAAKEISKTLNCELTERCDDCGKEDALIYDFTGKYEHICLACSQAKVS
ncbi:TPA: hypothetical protein ACGU7T_004564 [Vibrio vulnificus]|uniref:hypothetical protein n=1 Tax=Vibrio vulnificus TaxID=672 RepID=UPI001A35BAC8|nr:hypothetical protein [Vibrio vulnificus]HAS6415527.1 hypothetical protein [Vibrio vulnificus]HDY7429343.1 hypothetical protein [Vibrio vulnificus]HDY7489171.1 hypothetical protein [Vibrio vulnificus]HDY7951861.1 hypothetical protein [Vibrio vulnificus]